jgi:hypothetical protein
VYLALACGRLAKTIGAKTGLWALIYASKKRLDANLKALIKTLSWLKFTLIARLKQAEP